MKVGQIFDLPENIRYEPGHIAKLKNQDETKVIGKYEVIEVEAEPHVKVLKGRVIVTYGHKRAKKALH